MQRCAVALVLPLLMLFAGPALGADGVAVVAGRALPDAGPSDDAKAWIGALPRDGNYLITVTLGAGASAAPVPYNLPVALQ